MAPLRVLVCGSREWGDRATIRYYLSRLPSGSVVVQGCARGADIIAREIAMEIGLKVEDYPAQWEVYGRRAGIVRNIEMLDTKPDRVLAFWDGKSRGTAHTIAEAKRRGIHGTVVRR